MIGLKDKATAKSALEAHFSAREHKLRADLNAAFDKLNREERAARDRVFALAAAAEPQTEATLSDIMSKSMANNGSRLATRLDGVTVIFTPLPEAGMVVIRAQDGELETNTPGDLLASVEVASASQTAQPRHGPPYWLVSPEDATAFYYVGQPGGTGESCYMVPEDEPEFELHALDEPLPRGTGESCYMVPEDGPAFNLATLAIDEGGDELPLPSNSRADRGIDLGRNGSCVEPDFELTEMYSDSDYTWVQAKIVGLGFSAQQARAFTEVLSGPWVALAAAELAHQWLALAAIEPDFRVGTTDYPNEFALALHAAFESREVWEQVGVIVPLPRVDDAEKEDFLAVFRLALGLPQES